MRLIKIFFSLFRSGAGESRDYNRMYGKWHVIYPDGLVSENMCLDVARSYANIFKGRVEFNG